MKKTTTTTNSLIFVSIILIRPHLFYQAIKSISNKVISLLYLHTIRVFIARMLSGMHWFKNYQWSLTSTLIEVTVFLNTLLKETFVLLKLY